MQNSIEHDAHWASLPRHLQDVRMHVLRGLILETRQRRKEAGAEESPAFHLSLHWAIDARVRAWQAATAEMRGTFEPGLSAEDLLHEAHPQDGQAEMLARLAETETVLALWFFSGCAGNDQLARIYRFENMLVRRAWWFSQTLPEPERLAWMCSCWETVAVVRDDD